MVLSLVPRLHGRMLEKTEKIITLFIVLLFFLSILLYSYFFCYIFILSGVGFDKIFSLGFDRLCSQTVALTSQVAQDRNMSIGEHRSLRKHPFLLALRHRGHFARRNVCDSAAEIPY